MNSHLLQFDDIELYKRLCIEKNIKYNEDNYYKLYGKFNIYYIRRVMIINDIQKIYLNGFKETMIVELKRDYINKYGIEKYLIEQDNITSEFMNIITKQRDMLKDWNDI